MTRRNFISIPELLEVMCLHLMKIFQYCVQGVEGHILSRTIHNYPPKVTCNRYQKQRHFAKYCGLNKGVISFDIMQ